MKLSIAASVFALFLCAGCVTTTGPKSVEEIPAKERPVFDVTYSYTECAMMNYQKILDENTNIVAPSWKEGLIPLAEQACDACGKQLLAYSDFIEQRTEDKEFADIMTDQLRGDTIDFMVESTIEQIEKSK